MHRYFIYTKVICIEHAVCTKDIGVFDIVCDIMMYAGYTAEKIKKTLKIVKKCLI